jgi:uncharacterized protein (TIGR02271 family)
MDPVRRIGWKQKKGRTMANTSTTQTAAQSGCRYPDDLAELQNLEGWEITEGQPDPRGYDLTDRSGKKIGTIQNLLASPSTRKIYFAVVEPASGTPHGRFAVPLEKIRFDRNHQKAMAQFTDAELARAPEYRQGKRNFDPCGDYWLGGAAQAATAPGGAATREVRVPVTEESAAVRKEQHEAGAVIVHKEVETKTQHISEPVTRTHVETETRAVPPGTPYAAGAGATALREGETLRIPIVEEELVVEKQPRVTQEVIIRTSPETEQVEKDVQLRHERVEVEEEGDVDLEQARRSR